VTHRKTYDLTNSRDWRTLADDGVDSADESNKISERSLSGKRRIAVAGKPAGKLLYGYLREYNPHTRAYIRQVEHPEQGPIIRRMAAAVVAGRKNTRIAAELNAEGVPRPSGEGRWRGRDIARYVTQPAYVRQRVHQKQVLPDVEADWPAILDLDTWRKCCALISAPGRLMHQGTDMKWFLTGVVACSIDGCDGRLRPHKGAGKRRYACHECWRLAVGGEELDAYVTAVVLERLRRSDAAELFHPQTDDTAVLAAEEDARALRVELAEWRALAVARKVSPASFAEIEAGLLPKLADAEARARELATPMTLPELEGIDVAAEWEHFGPRLQREIVCLLMQITLLPAPKRGAKFTPERVRIAPRQP
jgi:site-specific DNA recombinase